MEKKRVFIRKRSYKKYFEGKNKFHNNSFNFNCSEKAVLSGLIIFPAVNIGMFLGEIGQFCHHYLMFEGIFIL